MRAAQNFDGTWRVSNDDGSVNVNCNSEKEAKRMVAEHGERQRGRPPIVFRMHVEAQVINEVHTQEEALQLWARYSKAVEALPFPARMSSAFEQNRNERPT